MDADTLTIGTIVELFGSPFTVTSFAHWNTGGRMVGGRLQQWADRGLHADTVSRLRQNPEPALNTGVTSWNRTQAEHSLAAWEELTHKGHECSFSDELAAQILLGEHPEWFRVLPDRWNASPTYSSNLDDGSVRVLHFHGRRYVRKDGPAAMYRPHLLAAMEANTGGIADWLREVDEPLWSLSQ